MAYCRWSSDNFKSDVYVYEDVLGGWTTHVASRRYVGTETLPESGYDLIHKVIDEQRKLTKGDAKRVAELNNVYHEAVRRLEMEGIDHPMAGQSFNDTTPQECAERLRDLKREGFRVPDGVIETLENEEVDLDAVENEVRQEDIWH